jgi:organic radical activating enzyme
MSKVIIPSYRETDLLHRAQSRAPMADGSSLLTIAECFSDTVQGEGHAIGYPSTFLRMKGCVLNCDWCDSSEVWRYGNQYSVKELLSLWEKNGVIDGMKRGQHLVLTGGSPLKQQDGLAELLTTMRVKYGFSPFTEVENECVIKPSVPFMANIDQWNNSPKLSNSGMKESIRYNPEVIKYTAERPNSYFKFVVSDTNKDWKEINDYFLKPGLIKRNQVILMPEGATREQLSPNYNSLVDLCCREGVRLSDRLHITIWNKKVGV